VDIINNRLSEITSTTTETNTEDDENTIDRQFTEIVNAEASADDVDTINRQFSDIVSVQPDSEFVREENPNTNRT